MHPPRLRRPTATFVAGVAALASALALAGCGRRAGVAGAVSSSGTAQIGGAFRLVDQNGRVVTDQDLKGKPSAVFFGFTACPEVCPTTLAELTADLKALGPDAGKLNVIYVTVDPERDTPQQLHAYLAMFDPRIRGLTGRPEAIAQAAKAYRVYYKKVPLPGGGYTMDHSAAVYLMDREGRFFGLLAYQMPQDQALASLRRLIGA